MSAWHCIAAQNSSLFLYMFRLTVYNIWHAYKKNMVRLCKESMQKFRVMVTTSGSMFFGWTKIALMDRRECIVISDATSNLFAVACRPQHHWVGRWSSWGRGGYQRCNAPDITFHIRNSDSCLFQRCDLLFPSWLGFICCFAFCSCYASHLMSSCALHRHRFHKTCIRSCSAGSLRCPFWARPHSHAPAAPPKYYFISGIKMFSEWVATCRAVLL